MPKSKQKKSTMGNGKLYLKLRSGTWLLIKGRGAVAPISGARVFGLIGESIDGEPMVGDEKNSTIYVSAFRITRYLLKILEEGIKGTLLALPVTKETYKLEIYGAPKNYVNKLIRIAEEMKALKIPKKKV